MGPRGRVGFGMLMRDEKSQPQRCSLCLLLVWDRLVVVGCEAESAQHLPEAVLVLQGSVLRREAAPGAGSDPWRGSVHGAGHG